MFYRLAFLFLSRLLGLPVTYRNLCIPHYNVFEHDV